jgi:2-polyprenyl-3-methyl-5-hydroxy-6-metoxy-1,4-benzoquinol methylase
MIKTLAVREGYRDEYCEQRDPISADRLLWRAHSFRQMVHLLPQQTVLELGAGRGLFTRQLFRVSRGESPITAVTFSATTARQVDSLTSVEFLNASSLPGILAGRKFDFVVAIDLLDRLNGTWFLRNVYELLKPGGEVVLYESNPRNPVLQLRRSVSTLVGRKDPRHLLSCSAIANVLSEAGFVNVFTAYNDFVYAPLTRALVWPLRNLSIVLENAPWIQTLAGSILAHARRPSDHTDRPTLSLFEHEQLRSAVSVVIPCHNEEMNIAPLISGLKGFYGDYLHQIIPVDDNSTDGTASVIRRLAEADPLITPVFRSPPNGVGRAIVDGCRAATGRYLLSIDCDFQHLLPEMRDLFDAAAEGCDVVIGSRFSRLSVLLNYPFQKIIANRGFHLLAKTLLRRQFRDLTNNLKLMRREVLENLELTQPGFAINAETGLLPLLMGYSVKEVPISWINRSPEMGVSSFRLASVGGSYCQVLVRCCLKTAFGWEIRHRIEPGRGRMS